VKSVKWGGGEPIRGNKRVERRCQKTKKKISNGRRGEPDERLGGELSDKGERSWNPYATRGNGEGYMVSTEDIVRWARTRNPGGF